MKLPPRPAGRYANALLSLSLESEVLPRVSGDLASIARALEESPDLSAFLGNTRIPGTLRRDTLQALFRDRVHPLTWKFLLFLEAKRRLDLLPEICPVFAALEESRRQIVRGEMTTAFRAPGDALETMAARFGTLLGKTVLLRGGEDPALLGGCRVRVGDLVYDFSLAARLRLARRTLTGAR